MFCLVHSYSNYISNINKVVIKLSILIAIESKNFRNLNFMPCSVDCNLRVFNEFQKNCGKIRRFPFVNANTQ